MGLILKKLRLYIGDDNITRLDLEGSVRDYPELNIFQQQLKSDLFVNPPRFEDTDFRTTLVINKDKDL